MTLAQLGELLRAHGVQVTVYYASDSGLDAFRSVALQNLATAGDFLLVNYQRDALGQGEIGHISPIAAYNVKTDRLLILDVASYRYPPVWVSTEVLWKAMNTVDPASGARAGSWSWVSPTNRCTRPRWKGRSVNDSACAEQGR